MCIADLDKFNLHGGLILGSSQFQPMTQSVQIVAYYKSDPNAVFYFYQQVSVKTHF